MAYTSNSTWFQATNSVLQLAQLPVVANTQLFDAGQLTKYQAAAQWLIDLAQRHLSKEASAAFTNRKFQLPIQQGTTDYILDAGISAESLKYHSWYNITAGSPYTGFLPLMKYEDYMDAWPDQTIIQQGPPEYMVQLPYDRQLDVTQPQPRIRVFPIPDNQYTLQYQATLNFYPLVNSSSIILFPPEYEHGLWVWAWKFLEVDLAEGREQMLDMLVDQVVSRIRTVAQPAEEVRKGVRMMKLNGRTNNYRRSYMS